MKSLNYRILLRKEPEGGYTAIIPTLPGCVTYGHSIEEAVEMAKKAIKLTARKEMLNGKYWGVILHHVRKCY